MDDDAAVEARIGAVLRDRGETLAVAESCTGGLVGSLVTDVAGASDYFVGGVITYTNRSKRGTLAVARESLERHGAVSKPVAAEMARHVRDEAGATWGLSTTGYADPSGGSQTEPPGTVYVGVAYAGSGTDEPGPDRPDGGNEIGGVDDGSDAGDPDGGNEVGDPGEGSDAGGRDDERRDGDRSYALVERHQFEGTRREVKRRIAEQTLATALMQIRSSA